MKKFTISVVILTVLVAVCSFLLAEDPDLWGWYCDRGPWGNMECDPGTCQAYIIADPVYGTNCAAWCSGVYIVQDCNKKCLNSICATAGLR
jgi:hypothetical protein